MNGESHMLSQVKEKLIEWYLGENRDERASGFSSEKSLFIILYKENSKETQASLGYQKRIQI